MFINRPMIFRSRKLYSLISNAFVKKSFSTEKNAFENLSKKTDDLLYHLSCMKKDDHRNFTLSHVDEIMMDWSKQCDQKSSERAEDLLVALEQNYDRVFSDPGYSSSLLPNSISYNHVLNAFAQSNGGAQAATKCNVILDRMITRCQAKESTKYPMRPPGPLVTTFNTAMNAWSKSKDYNAGVKAERIFRQMELWNYDIENDHQSMHKATEPNTRSLAIVLDSWANSHHPLAFDRILGIFYNAVDKVVNKSPLDNESRENNSTKTIPLNTVVFNSVLNGLANSSRGIEAAEKAKDVFNIMQELPQKSLSGNMSDCVEDELNRTTPNTTTWSLLLKCWTNAVDPTSDDGGVASALQAEAILNKMEESYESKPNAISYTSCMKAWSKCASKVSANRALSILERMENLSDATNDEEYKPNVIHYNTCLSAFCRITGKDTVSRAEQLFQRMQNAGVVDTVSYNTMMQLYLNNDPIHAHAEVDMLYEEMQAKHVYPDTATFNIMMDTWKKSTEKGSTEKVIWLLDHMVALSKNDPDFSVSVQSFTIALNTIAHSNLDEKVTPASKIFHKLISLHEARNDDKMKPDVRTFAAFISTCANQNGNSERKRFALKLALGAYEQLCNEPLYGKPNSFIYGGLMKACGRFSYDRENFRLMERTFNKCIEDGQLSKINFNIFLKSSAHDLKKKMLSGLPSKRLPFEWYRNVKVHERP